MKKLSTKAEELLKAITQYQADLTWQNSTPEHRFFAWQARQSAVRASAHKINQSQSKKTTPGNSQSWEKGGKYQQEGTSSPRPPYYLVTWAEMESLANKRRFELGFVHAKWAEVRHELGIRPQKVNDFLEFLTTWIDSKKSLSVRNMDVDPLLSNTDQVEQMSLEIMDRAVEIVDKLNPLTAEENKKVAAFVEIMREKVAVKNARR